MNKFYKWVLPALLLTLSLVGYIYGMYEARYVGDLNLSFIEWFLETQWDYAIDNYISWIVKPFIAYYSLIIILTVSNLIKKAFDTAVKSAVNK